MQANVKEILEKIVLNSSGWGKKNRQVTYIAPLNRIPLLSSDPGGVL